MTRAIDIQGGPTKPFGSAYNRAAPPIPLVTEPTIRPRAINNGRCPTCGSRFFGCHDEDET